MSKALRICLVALALLAALGTMVALASGGTEGGAKAAEKPTLKVLTHTGWAAVLPPANNELPVYKEYERLTNIHIEWENIQATNYAEVVRPRLAAGTSLPDIINMAGLGDMSQYGRDGLIIAQNDLIEKYAPNIKKWWATPGNEIYKFLDTFPDGKIWGVNGYVLAQFLTMGYLWNKTWLDAIGHPAMPEKIDDFVSVLKAFRDKDPNGNGKKDEIPLTPAAGAGYINILSNMFGFQYSIVTEFQLDKNKKIYSAYLDPRFKEFLAFVNMLYTEGLLDKAYSTDSWTQTLEKVGNDRVGLITCWATFTGTYTSAHPKGDKTASKPLFVNGPPIEGPYGDKYFVRREIRGGDAMGITKDCKIQDVAMRWIDFVRNSDEALKLQNYGVEGMSYKMEGGKVVPTPPAGKEFSTYLAEIGGSQPPFTHLQWAPGWDMRFPAWAIANDKSYAKYYKVPDFPAVNATKEEQDSINKLSTDINTYRAEMTAKFITGAEPLTKFDEYVAQMKKLGMDEMYKIRQQQYDRYLKLTGK